MLRLLGRGRTAGLAVVAVLAGSAVVTIGPVSAEPLSRVDGGGVRIAPTTVSLRDAQPAPAASTGTNTNQQATIQFHRQGPRLPVRPSSGTKQVAPAVPPERSPVNRGTSRDGTVAPQAAPNLLVLDVESTTEAEAGGFTPSDVNAAVSSDQIVEVTNAFIKVRSKPGPQACTADLRSFLRTTILPSDPRIQFDNLNNRFSLVAIRAGDIEPTQTPMMFLATSMTSDACGQWHVYNLTFAQTAQTPTGSDLDFPNLGQDRNALLVTADSFASSGARLGPIMFSLNKAAVYSGAFIAQPVTFSGGGPTAGVLAPVRVAGQPITPTGVSYFIAAEPGVGYRLFRMMNSASPSPTVVPHGTVSAPFTAPTRQVNQCGTSLTLDPLDGRIGAPAVFAGGSVFFTHGADTTGFPSVMYGAISVSDNTLTRGLAFHSGSSDDFNPSISVEQVDTDQFTIWLNWAYTDTGANPCQNVSVTVDGARPGQGIPNLTATGMTLVTSQSAGTDERFGDYSSVVADPQPVSTVCGTRSSAVLAQQYFAPSGEWRTRIARFCHTP